MAVASPLPPSWRVDPHLNIRHKQNERSYSPPNYAPVWAYNDQVPAIRRNRYEGTSSWTARKAKVLISANDGKDHLTTLPPEVLELIFEYSLSAPDTEKTLKNYVRWIKVSRATVATAYGHARLRDELQRRAILWWKEETKLSKDIIRTMVSDLKAKQDELDKSRSDFADKRRDDFEKAERRYRDLYTTHRIHMDSCTGHPSSPNYRNPVNPTMDRYFNFMNVPAVTMRPY